MHFFSCSLYKYIIFENLISSFKICNILKTPLTVDYIACRLNQEFKLYLFVLKKKKEKEKYV